MESDTLKRAAKEVSTIEAEIIHVKAVNVQLKETLNSTRDQNAREIGILVVASIIFIFPASLKSQLIQQKMPHREKKQEMERLLEEVRKSLEGEQKSRQIATEKLTEAYLRIDEYEFCQQSALMMQTGITCCGD